MIPPPDGYSILNTGPYVQAKKRRGVMIIEAAFSIVVLLLLTLGLVHFAVSFHTTLCAQHTCREAARFASVNGRKPSTGSGTTLKTADDAIISRAVSVGRAMGLNLVASDISVTPPISTTGATAGVNSRTEGQVITITVRYDLKKRQILSGGPFGYSPVYSVSEQVILEGPL